MDPLPANHPGVFVVAKILIVWTLACGNGGRAILLNAQADAIVVVHPAGIINEVVPGLFYCDSTCVGGPVVVKDCTVGFDLGDIKRSISPGVRGWNLPPGASTLREEPSLHAIHVSCATAASSSHAARFPLPSAVVPYQGLPVSGRHGRGVYVGVLIESVYACCGGSLHPDSVCDCGVCADPRPVAPDPSGPNPIAIV